MSDQETRIDRLVPGEPTSVCDHLPALIVSAGEPARFVWSEFFQASISNRHTRRAYMRAVTQFLEFCEQHHVQLHDISPSQVGFFVENFPGRPATRKVVLAALRRFFDLCVMRHLILFNPASTVRGERTTTKEGKTPRISVDQARLLIHSVDVSTLTGLRDRAILTTLAYTAARVGALSKLNLEDFYETGSQFCLHFDEKGGTSREIPVRHDLQEYVQGYLDALGETDSKTPLFRTANRRTGKLTENRMSPDDISAMVKRRIRRAKLPERLSPHSFRVAIATDLLEQNVSLEEVQRLLGHADARTTRLYDRRQQKITRNLVERIPI